MDVSVVIPTHNRAALVSRAIRSVFGQTLAPREIIVVDDGSDDGTAPLLARTFPSVTILRQANAGVSAARNRGINAATGEWIALLDSDDEWLPRKLELQAKLLAGHPEVRVCHTDEIWIRNGRRVNPGRRHAKPEGRIFRQCLPLCCVSPSSVLLHGSVLADAGLFDPDLPACEDYDLWLRVFQRYRAGLVKEPCVIKYGGHHDQLSRRHWGMDRFRVHSLDKLLLRDTLDAGDRGACIDTLRRKCEILVQGMERRGNVEGAGHYRRISNRWSAGQPAC